MTKHADMRIGQIAAQVLEVACKHPDQAYAHSITKLLRQKHGIKHTHDLEVGNALRWLASEALLKCVGRIRGEFGKDRLMYQPTTKAAFILTLQGYKG